ncbi:transposase, MuDR, MULE transposase domain protein [Tanacetum coccineum]
MHHRNATAKLLGRLLEPKFKDNTRIYKGKDIKQDIYTNMNIDIKLTNDGTVTNIETDDEDRFKMVFIALGVVVSIYEGTNLLAVGMDGNNQIIPIATDGPLDELSDWAKAKIRKRMQKSLNWVVVGIAVDKVYEVDDRRRIQTVELCNGTCTCRTWQVSRLHCGHVLAICRVIGLTDCNHLAKGWFMRIALKGTYQELVYPVGEVSSWQIPNYLLVVKPPHMDKQPSSRPKSTKPIRSQGEEPVTVRCGRCGVRGHNRQGCRETISYTKKRTYPRGSSQQADDYLPQSMLWSFDAVNLDDP